MKITHSEVLLLRAPVEHAYVAGGRAVDANWHVLARLTTADGIQGIGYVVKQRADLTEAIASAARELGERLIGANVLAPEAAWHDLASQADWVGPGGLLNWALAPLDIALWDAAGKALGQPLHRLLGGARDGIPAYASDGLWYSLSLDDLAASAKRHADNGYGALKLRLAKDPDAEALVTRIGAVREAVGPAMGIMVDATENWQPSEALTLGRRLQEAGVCWLEDPVRHEDEASLAMLRRSLDLQITGGEHLYTLAQFRRLFEAGGVDVPIIDLARIGGITPWRKAAAMAEAYGLPVCGHVMPEVHAHLLAAVPNGHMMEYMPRSTAILCTMPEPEKGMLNLGEAPGLGLELDEAAVERFRVD